MQGDAGAATLAFEQFLAEVKFLTRYTSEWLVELL